MSTGAGQQGRWQQQAACIGADPTLFHPEGYSGRPYKQARAICATCVVREPCLEGALGAMVSDKDDETDIAWGRHGMFGGRTPEEREAILRERRKGAA